MASKSVKRFKQGARMGQTTDSRPVQSHSAARKAFLAGPLMGWCLGRRLCPSTENFGILLLRMEHFGVLFIPFLQVFYCTNLDPSAAPPSLCRLAAAQPG